MLSCSKGEGLVANLCVPCVPGTFSTSYGDCSRVPIGFYTLKERATKYLPCASAEDAGASICSLFDGNQDSHQISFPGYYSPDGIMTYLCPNGYFSSLGASSCQPCSAFEWFDNKSWLEESLLSMLYPTSPNNNNMQAVDVRAFLCNSAFDKVDSAMSSATETLSMGASDMPPFLSAPFQSRRLSGTNSTSPSKTPTALPTVYPTTPTAEPTTNPTTPTAEPTTNPTTPTATPTTRPSRTPTTAPSYYLDPLQRGALMDFFYATGGPRWVNKLGWGSSQGYNTWYGVTVDPIGNAAKLIFAQNNHNGTLPTTLALLTALQSIQISNSFLRGSIPTELGLLSNTLNDFRLKNNTFAGTLPTEIGLLTKMVYFSVRSNFMTGTIPSYFWKFSLMTNLLLRDNKFHGTLPTDVGNMKSMQNLWLANNKLNGTIPSELMLLTQMIFLDLSNNSFIGTIPSTIGNYKMQYLYLNDNKLTGTLPSTLSTIFAPHTYFNIMLMLQNNRFTGEIDSAYCYLNEVFLMYTSGNQFSCYEMCTTLANHVMYLDFISGSSPYLVCSNQYAALCELEQSLNINSFLASSDAIIELTTIQQSIPDVPVERGLVETKTICNVPGCPLWVSLNNSYSYFEPSISQYQLTFGQGIYAGSLLYGQLNMCIVCNSTRCVPFVVDMNAQQLPGIGTMPPWVSSDPVLNVSCYRKTNLMRVVPPPVFVGFYFTIKRFVKPVSWNCEGKTGFNGIQGLNPCLWQGIDCVNMNSVVSSIRLSRSGLNGSLPVSLGELSFLQMLDMSYNAITGSIPASLGNITTLQIINLTSNALMGTLPSTFSNLKRIQQVYLSTNQISGTLPSWLPQLKSTLTYLDLRANLLEGKVIHPLCSLNNTLINLDSNVLLTCYEGCEYNSMTSPSMVLSPGLPYCAPSSVPTSAPSYNPAPTITFTTAARNGVIAGCVVAAFLIAIYVGLRYRKYESYLRLPIHRAILMKSAITEQMIEQYGYTAMQLDGKGATAIDLIIASKGKYEISVDIFYLLMMESLPFDTDTGKPKETSAIAWAKLIQKSDDVACAVVDRIVSDFDAYIDLLAYGVDADGRTYIDIASLPCRDTLHRAIYLHRRFELKPGPPEHKSETSLVRFAVDHCWDEEGKDRPKKVALKFMKVRTQYLTEIRTRDTCGFAKEYVLMIMESFDGDSTEDEQLLFRASALKKGFDEYPYCLVMDVADTNLQSYIMKQNIAGKDWDVIRQITKALSQCLRHIHSKHIMHGDIKPMNIVLLESAVRLIDFDACANFHPLKQEYSGCKYSSAYLPPEMFYYPKPNFVAVKSNFHNSSMSRSIKKLAIMPDIPMLLASPAQDMWSLGVILYLLCTGRPLFAASVEDNIASFDMHQLLEWDDDLKEEKLFEIEDKYARNLLSLLLSKDPASRPDADHVISHPFISGMAPGRLQGEEPEYDVFLSYRVDSDSGHVEMLYNTLVGMELRVWWDKICLVPGQPWEEGFCDGLVNSCCFVCLLSKNAINHPTKPWQNFTQLEESSRCDNVLLEWRLALELRERRMIDGVFPVFFGNASSENITEYSDYFASGCHPSPLPNIAVTTVEAKVREHLGRQGLGLPYRQSQTVRAIVGDITANQGGFVKGDLEATIVTVCESIRTMRRQIRDKKSTISPSLATISRDSTFLASKSRDDF